jgi:hypothetical protein
MLLPIGNRKGVSLIMNFAQFAILAGSSGGGGHVDPMKFSLNELAAIRGAMWPQAGPNLKLPYGPRPYQPDNIVATDFLWDYPADLRMDIVKDLAGRGYKNAVVGPIVDSDGYHGVWTPNDWRTKFDQFLDMHEFLWDNGLNPITFIHPDGWTLEQTKELTPLFQSERAQRLIRIVVPTGWEPTRYGWSSNTWMMFCQWARELLPNALVLIHTVADTDAPVGTDENGDDNGKPNGEGWARVAPYLHGWLIQNGQNGGSYSSGPAAQPGLAYNFGAQFDTGAAGAATHSPAWHFANGISSWPVGSAWGPNIRIRLYNAECTSFCAFWQDPNPISEPDRCAWGDLAMANGAHGYLDGGTAPVPPTP